LDFFGAFGIGIWRGIWRGAGSALEFGAGALVWHWIFDAGRVPHWIWHWLQVWECSWNFRNLLTCFSFVFGLWPFITMTEVKLRPLKFTRYFLFTRVNPKPGDFETLFETCKRIDAYMGCKRFNVDGRERLVGFIVLRGNRAFLRSICREFPNFNITEMPGHGWEGVFNEDSYDIIVNKHPFIELKRKLFH